MSTRWQPRHTRLLIVAVVLLGLGVAVALALFGLSQKVTYFYTPSDVKEKAVALLAEKKNIRLGGLVEKGSIQQAGEKGLSITFVVTDKHEKISVHYEGLRPDLFRDGQGVVAEGQLASPALFEAHTLLAKHDEKYMPPEVAKAMQKQEMDIRGKSP